MKKFLFLISLFVFIFGAVVCADAATWKQCYKDEEVIIYYDADTIEDMGETFTVQLKRVYLSQNTNELISSIVGMDFGYVLNRMQYNKDIPERRILLTTCVSKNEMQSFGFSNSVSWRSLAAKPELNIWYHLKDMPMKKFQITM